MKRKKSRKRLVLFILLVLFLYTYSLEDGPVSVVLSSNIDGIFKDFGAKSGIYSQNAVLSDLETGEIIFRRNVDEKIYPASLTKIMTTIVALENMGSLDDSLVLKSSDFEGIYESGAAVAGFRAGDRVSKRDLLYGTMLASGQDAVNGLVNNMGGEEVFVSLMNRKAGELGMTRTNFVNASGLHDDQHYTSVGDLTILFKYALKNGHFRAIISKESYLTEYTDLKIYSSVYSKLDRESLGDYSFLGGKTGYTERAGLCLASLVEKDGREYILITTKAKGGPKTRQYNFLDSYYIYNNYL